MCIHTEKSNCFFPCKENHLSENSLFTFSSEQTLFTINSMNQIEKGEEDFFVFDVQKQSPLR